MLRVALAILAAVMFVGVGWMGHALYDAARADTSDAVTERIAGTEKQLLDTRRHLDDVGQTVYELQGQISNFALHQSTFCKELKDMTDRQAGDVYLRCSSIGETLDMQCWLVTRPK
mgnify:CR=1 FL=1